MDTNIGNIKFFSGYMYLVVCIWSLIHGNVKQLWGWVAKKCYLQKSVTCIFLVEAVFLACLRWFHHDENFKKYFFLKYIWWCIFIIKNLSKNQNIVLIMTKNWLSVCYIHFLQTWYLKNLWKIHENFSVTLS